MTWAWWICGKMFGWVGHVICCSWNKDPRLAERCFWDIYSKWKWRLTWVRRSTSIYRFLQGTEEGFHPLNLLWIKICCLFLSFFVRVLVAAWACPLLFNRSPFCPHSRRGGFPCNVQHVSRVWCAFLQWVHHSPSRHLAFHLLPFCMATFLSIIIEPSFIFSAIIEKCMLFGVEVSDSFSLLNNIHHFIRTRNFLLPEDLDPNLIKLGFWTNKKIIDFILFNKITL